jgi:predicted ATPase
LVAAELLYQRGLPPQATYHFKHTLFQEAAYQSLLHRTRRQYHQQIAQVLEAQFPDTAATQPELLAHHYTAADCAALAVGSWQRAGERALRQSAHPEAVRHLTTALELLATLPETPARAHQELTLQTALGGALATLHGFGAAAVERPYARARALCRQLGETPQLFPVLMGLRSFYTVRGEFKTARVLGEQLLHVAHSTPRGIRPSCWKRITPWARSYSLPGPLAWRVPTLRTVSPCMTNGSTTVRLSSIASIPAWGVAVLSP